MQRQIKACTHCRQHKVKCDAAKCYPEKCSRCRKFCLKCVIDQHFRPQRGGQVELLREHIAQMQEQIHAITSNGPETKKAKKESHSPPGNVKTPSPTSLDLPSFAAVHKEEETDVKQIEASVAERMAAGGRLEPVRGPYKLENVVLEEPKANEMHDYFIRECVPYMPMFESITAGELYARSEFLFWTVMVTAAASEPTAELYLSLVGPVKHLAATKCLLATTRSSSIVQALLVLSTWPLPSEKMLEDMSLRYASLAYSMGLQLGIHRGKFIYEFSRNQQLMPNAVKWRTRTWVQTYITQHMISASTGIPAAMPVDHVVDHALHDDEHPLSARTVAMLKISMFYSKLVALMGSNISTMDGLMDASLRCPTLDLLKTDLYTLFPPTTDFADPVIEITFLYARCLLDCFAFLPDTPIASQGAFVMDAFQACTRIVTVVRQLVGTRRITEFPIFVRNPCSLAAIILFRLQLLPALPEQCVVSARESVITIHHMYRNLPPSWLEPSASNDVSRIAKLLESLNHVMKTYPELLHSRRVMRHMRSHLTFSMFYEYLYIIHEAKRRNAQKGEKGPPVNASFEESPPDQGSPKGTLRNLIHSNDNAHRRELNPLPLFSNISSDTFVSNTAISPNGTTLTKLTRTENTEDSDANLTPPREGDGRQDPKPDHQKDILDMQLDTFMDIGYPLDVDSNGVFMGLDWMNTEGDDFLGWMMPRNE